MSRVSAWDKHGVKAWHARENIGPIPKFISNRGRIGVISFHCRKPHPDVKTVRVSNGRHDGEHVCWRFGEVRAVGVVITLRRNELYGIASEEHEISHVLIPCIGVPRVIRVCFGPVPQLVSTKLLGW